MATTDKTRVRNAMGKRHKTVAELVAATGLPVEKVQRALDRLSSEGYTRPERLSNVQEWGYRRLRV